MGKRDERYRLTGSVELDEGFFTVELQEEEKNKSMKNSAFGIVGIETSAALTYTALVEPGVLTPMQMAEKMSYKQSKESQDSGHG